jgi:hypothetical protein
MHCQDAKRLMVRGERALSPAEVAALRAHLKECASCSTFKQRCAKPATYEARSCSCSSAPTSGSVSTERIMQAVRQQQRITDQLKDLRAQQQSRMKRLRPTMAAMAAIGFFTLGSIPLLCLAIMILQGDLFVKALTFLNNAIDVLVILAQYIQMGLLLAAHNNLLLFGVAFVVVVMMAMWLRLMRPPHDIPGDRAW